MESVEKIIERLKEIQQDLLKVSMEIREVAQENSFALFMASEDAGKAAEALKRNIPKEMEVEGGGTTWFMVCPECHGAIDCKDSFCRHCGQAVKNE